MVRLESFLITFILYTILIILTDDIISFIILLFIVLILFKKLNLDSKKAMRNIKSLKWFLAIILLMNCCFYTPDGAWFKFFIFTPSTIGLFQGIKIVFRTVLILLFSEIVLQQGSPLSLSNAFINILYPLKYLLLPIGTLSIILSLSLSFINILNDERVRIEKAQKIRGLTFEHKGIRGRFEAVSALLLPLFLSAFHKADELSFALDSRGFNPRRKIKKERFLFPPDYKFLFINFIIITLLFLGGLYVQY